MKCHSCKYKKRREQDGGIKILCIAFGGEEIGSGQSIIDDPAYPLKYHRDITDCEAYAPAKLSDEITSQVVEQLFKRDEPNRQDETNSHGPIVHPFGG